MVSVVRPRLHCIASLLCIGRYSAPRVRTLRPNTLPRNGLAESRATRPRCFLEMLPGVRLTCAVGRSTYLQRYVNTMRAGDDMMSPCDVWTGGALHAETTTRKIRTSLSHLPARVARCLRKSFREAACAAYQPTSLKCPPRIENGPAIRLWYVQRIVSRLERSGASLLAFVKLAKSRNPVGHPTERVCAPETSFSRFSQRTRAKS